MVKLRCSKCNEEWTVDEKDSKRMKFCPSCGGKLVKEEDNSLVNVLKDIFFNQDEDIMSNSSKFMGYLADYVKCTKKQNNLIRIATESGLYKELLRSNDRKTVTKQNIKKINEEYGIEVNNVIEMINWALEALGEDKIPYEEPKVVIKTVEKIVEKKVEVEKKIVPPKDTVKFLNNECVVDENKIIYKIIRANTVEVTYTSDYQYMGNIIIPSYVIYEGLKYNVEGIGKWAFDSCSDLLSVDLPDSITYISAYAFSGTIRLKNVNMNKCVNLKSIGENAFKNSSIKEIKIPSSVESLGAQCFWVCKQLTKIIMQGDEVRALGDSVFMDCTNLIEVRLSNNLGYIPCRAFYGCENLSIINTPSEIFAIREYAFYNCKLLKTFDLSKVQILGESAFQNCSKLEKIDISNIGDIPMWCFSGCSNLKEIMFSENLKNIHMSAFSDCIKLQNIDLPSKVYRIYNWAFEGCGNMEYIILPEKLDFVGYGAFMKCPKLKIYYKNSQDETLVWSPKWNCENSEVVYDYKG